MPGIAIGTGFGSGTSAAAGGSPDTLRVNGYLLSWGDCILTIGDRRWYKATSIDYEQKRPRVLGYGQSKAHAPLAMSRGRTEPGPFKVKMFTEMATDLRLYVASISLSGYSYGNPMLPIYLQYVKLGKVSTVEAINCVVTSDGSSHEESADPLQTTWEWQPTGYLIDGVGLADTDEDE
jgi:hypothetical protein